MVEITLVITIGRETAPPSGMANARLIESAIKAMNAMVRRGKEEPTFWNGCEGTKKTLKEDTTSIRV